MAIRSSLTKGVRRTGGNKKYKPQLEQASSDSLKTDSSYRKGSNQGDSDSEATSYTSSLHDSTSSATSSNDRYSSGVELEIQQKKTLIKLNSRKSTGFKSFRPSKSLPDDDSATTRHPIEQSEASLDHFQKLEQKFTRSGNLKSLRNLRTKRATFSSILKDSKFSKQVELPEGITKSEELLPVSKLCPYQHCSSHGNHHHEPPLKRFPYLKRRSGSSDNHKSVNPQIRSNDKQSVKKTEAKVTKKVTSKTKKKNKDVDYSIEFYAKTRSEPGYEANYGRDDVYLADIMFGVNDNNQSEGRKIQTIQDSVAMNGGKDENKEAYDVSGTKRGKPKGWSYVKKVMLVRRLITEVEHAKKQIELVPKPEADIVSLRHQEVGETKNSNEWMLDHALQQVVGELAITQKQKVALLVKAFETVTPK